MVGSEKTLVPRRRDSGRQSIARRAAVGLSSGGLDDESKFASTVEERERPVEPAARLRVIVVHDDGVRAFALPERGKVTLGRLPENEVCIDHPGVSRRHAVIHLGPPVQLEDLGSANGTRVRGSKLAPRQQVEILPGDAVELGSTLVILQGVPSVTRARRVWGHGYFEGRLEEECTRAEAQGSTFGVARIHVEGGGDAVEQTLAANVGPTDLVARYGPGEFEILLLDVSAQEAERLVREVAARLGEQRASVRTGLACYGRDGRSPEALLAHACAAIYGVVERAAGPVVVEDEAMRRLYELVSRVAPSQINVLLLGETGVGKEVVAEQLHTRSPRADKSFVCLNCAALSETLLESELFGHEKGAFTGAAQAKPGLLESAEGGTVFLDEVGELPASVQVKLLRVIEERRVLRVGGLKPRAIDVRFVAATNRDIEAEVARGAFRADLFFRLNGITLVIPPLRERVSEIEPLAKAFVAQASRQGGRPPPALTPEVVDLLRGYRWPGNIRELRNFMERAVLLCVERRIEPSHLPLDKMQATLVRSSTGPAPNVSPGPASVGAAAPTMPTTSVRDEAADIERQRILAVLEQCGGNQTRAAQLLAIPLRTLVRRLEAYGLPRPRKRGE